MFKVNGYISPEYSCPCCKRTFDSFDGANNCIKNHVVPVAIESFNDVDEIAPETVVIVLSNGNKAEYRFDGILVDDEEST